MPVTDEQYQKVVAKLKDGTLPDDLLDEAEKVIQEYKAQPKGETQADLEAKLKTTPATGLYDPGYPATGQQALEQESFAKAAAKMHQTLPAVRSAHTVNPKLPNASKREDLNAPPEYHPPTSTAAATDPLHPLDTFTSLLNQTKDSLPSTFGGKVQHYLEPPQLPGEPLDAYHERADKLWMAKVAEAQQLGIPVVREEYATPKGVGDRLMHDVQMGMGELASAGYGVEENAGGPVRALERSFAPEAAKNTDAIVGRFPNQHTAGMVAGAMSPLAPGNTVGRIIPELKGVAGGIATGAGRGALAAGTVQGLHDTFAGDYEGMGGRIGTSAVIGGAAGGVVGGLGGAARAHGESLDASNPGYAEAKARGLLDDRTIFGGVRPDENIQAFRGKAIPGSSAEQVAATEIAPDILSTAQATKAGEIERVGGAKEKFFAEHPQEIHAREMADAAQKNALALSGTSGEPLPGEIPARDLPRLQKLHAQLRSPKVDTIGEKADSLFHQQTGPDEFVGEEGHFARNQDLKGGTTEGIGVTAEYGGEAGQFSPTKLGGGVDNYRAYLLKQAGASDAEIAKMTNDEAQRFLDFAHAQHPEMEPARGPVLARNRDMLKKLGVPEAAINSLEENGDARALITKLTSHEGATDVDVHADTHPDVLRPSSPTSAAGAPAPHPGDLAAQQKLGQQFKETYSLKGARRVIGRGLDPALAEAGIPGATPNDVPENVRVRLTDKTFTPRQYEEIVAGLQDPRQGNLRGLGEIQAAGHAGRERITGTTPEMPEGYAKFIAGEHGKMNSLEQMYGDAGIPLVDKSGKPSIPAYNELTSDQRNHLVNTIIKNAHGGLPEQVTNAQKIANQADVGSKFTAIHENALVSDLEDQMKFHIRPGLGGVHLTGSPSNIDAARLRLDPALQKLGLARGGAVGNLVPKAREINVGDIQRLLNPIGQ